MKTELKAKYLQHLIKKKNKDEGFTLIELLVVIIIIGILAASALPSFLNQAAKARGAEAKSNVGAMNRAQQAQYLEKQTFTSTFADLGLSFPTATDNFDYKISSATSSSVINQGSSKKTDIKSYGGGAYYANSATSTILCEANTAGASDVSPSGSASCGSAASQVK